MVQQSQTSPVTVAAVLYPLGGLWPAKPEAEERPLPSWDRMVVSVVGRIRDGLALRRTRRQLMELDDRILRDVGLSRSDLLELELGSGSRKPLR